MKKILLTLVFLIGIGGIFLLIFPFQYNEAEKIVEALEEFKNDHQKYPSSLEEMIPNYKKRIFHAFEYRSIAPENYSLSFEEKDIFGYEYYHAWLCNPVDGCYTDFGD